MASPPKPLPPKGDIAAPTDYPTMLYKAGGQIEWDGKALDTLVVADAEAFHEAAADGWLTAADLGTV